MGNSFRQTVAGIFSHPQMDSSVMLSGHLQQTIERCKASRGNYLVVAQDTTYYNYCGHKSMADLGFIQGNIKGVMQHNSLVMNESGVALGLIDQQYWSRKSTQPFEGLESQKWFNSLEAVNKYVGNLEKTVVLVQDREADILGFFKARREPSVELLVRVHQPRNLEILADNRVLKLTEIFQALPFLGQKQVNITRNNKEITLTLQLKAAQVNVLPDKSLNAQLHKVQGLSLVIAEEVAAIDKNKNSVFDEKERAVWYLLTSLPIENLDQIERVVTFYGLRWIIERFHFTMKSGALNVERLQFDDLKTTINALTFYSVVGWKLLAITYLIRQDEDHGATGCFAKQEIELLCKLSKKSITTVKQAALALTEIVSFSPTKKQPMPGIKVLAQAMERFHYIKIGAGIST